MAGHEQAWAEALAQEHAHQRELLATLRDELGTFARELASAVTALDAFVGLAGVTEAVATARTSARYASLAHDVARRTAGDERTSELYDAVGAGTVSAPLVGHAAELLRTQPRRTDRELLQAIVTASGATAQIEQILGPAPVAALAALRPLSRLVPALAARDAKKLRASATADLTQVLSATAALGAGAEATTAADASALADSLRETVAHVDGAVRAVEQGKLGQVLAESRTKLHEDLAKLRSIHEGAHDAPDEWRAARKEEHAALAEEVRVKLERVERTRKLLGLLLPRLQLVSRALTAVGRAHALEARLDPAPAAAVAAAGASLVFTAGELWEDAVASGATPEPSQLSLKGRTRWIVAAVIAAAAIALAIVLATTSSSKRASPPATTTVPTTTAAATTTAPPPQPRMSGVKATFSETARATTYSVAVHASGQGTPTITWRLVPPKDNPGCNRFAPVPGSPNEAVWHHSSTDGCTHNGIQHDGTVYVTVTTDVWKCTQSFFGTLTRQGSSAETCKHV